jgi:hypothetical protein
MRRTLIVLALAAAAVGWPAGAQDASDPATVTYYTALASFCPEKSLQLLSPSDLRDGLDDYQSGLPQEAQDRLRRAERNQCSSPDAGVGCVNRADIVAASQLGLTDNLAASICQSFLRCRSQSDCDHAR